MGALSRTVSGKSPAGWGICEHGGPDLGTGLTVAGTERRLWWRHRMSEKEGLERVTGARVCRPCGSHEGSEWRGACLIHMLKRLL